VKENTRAEASDLLLADLHCHTIFSDGLSSPESMAYEACLRGLHVLAITDHLKLHEDISQMKFRNYFMRCSKINVKGLTIIPGVEVSSLDGDIVCLLPSFRLPPDSTIVRGGDPANETIDAIHDLGGLALAAHPFGKRGVAEKLLELKFDGMEVENLTPVKYRGNSGLALVGSSDAHTRLGLGASYTCLEDNFGDRGQASIDVLLATIRKRNSLARTPVGGCLLRILDKIRWLRPDYTTRALLCRMKFPMI